MVLNDQRLTIEITSSNETRLVYIKRNYKNNNEQHYDM